MIYYVFMEVSRFILTCPNGVDNFIPGEYRWSVNWAVTDERKQAPSPGNHRRCQARVRRSIPPVQCGKWAKSGRRFCCYHGGRQPLFKERHMSKYFSKNAGPALKSILKHLADESPDEKLSLLEEVDISRQLALDAMKKYEAACLSGASVSEETQQLSRLVAKNALNNVVETVGKATRSRALSESVIDAENVAYLVSQVNGIVESSVDKPTALKIAAQLKELKISRTNRSGAVADAEAIRSALKEMDDVD